MSLLNKESFIPPTATDEQWAVVLEVEKVEQQIKEHLAAATSERRSKKESGGWIPHANPPKERPAIIMGPDGKPMDKPTNEKILQVADKLRSGKILTKEEENIINYTALRAQKEAEETRERTMLSERAATVAIEKQIAKNLGIFK